MILGRIYFRDVSLVDNHVFKCSNKNEHVVKESYFKVFGFVTVNNENTLSCYETYLHKIGFDRMNC